MDRILWQHFFSHVEIIFVNVMQKGAVTLKGEKINEKTQSREDISKLSRSAKTGRYLSKSLYIRGLQCHKSLYLEKFHRDIKAEITTGKQALFDSGHIVGLT